LQGEATSVESVHEIRQAIKEQRREYITSSYNDSEAHLNRRRFLAVTQLLLNYDKSGAPFFNLLCIIPLFAPTGELIYFVGGQTDVTGALGNGSRLQLPGRTPLPEEPNKSEIDLSAFSPIVQTSATYAAAANDANSIDEPRSKSAQSQNDDSAKSSSEPKHHYGEELLNGGGGGKEKSSSSSVRPRPFSKGSRHSFLGPKTWSTKPQPSTTITTTISDGDESPKLQYKQGTVERRVNEFQTTYEKLILVSRAGESSFLSLSFFLGYSHRSIYRSQDPLQYWSVPSILWTPSFNSRTNRQFSPDQDRPTRSHQRTERREFRRSESKDYSSDGGREIV